jgi:hypothetical protein
MTFAERWHVQPRGDAEHQSVLRVRSHGYALAPTLSDGEEQLTAVMAPDRLIAAPTRDDEAAGRADEVAD